MVIAKEQGRYACHVVIRNQQSPAQQHSKNHPTTGSGMHAGQPLQSSWSFHVLQA
jgi:hypothetical protein